MLTAYLISVIVCGIVIAFSGYAYHKSGNKITTEEYLFAVMATFMPILNIPWLIVCLYLAESQTSKKKE